MDNKLEQFLSKLTRQALIGIMWDALSMMQSSNTHSMHYCIVTSIGSEAIDNECGEYEYTLPTIAEANRMGQNSCLF